MGHVDCSGLRRRYLSELVVARSSESRCHAMSRPSSVTPKGGRRARQIIFEDTRRGSEHHSGVRKPEERLNGRVLTRTTGGLFSAVTSAFIVQVHSQLQLDPGEETAALLRILIYKIGNATFIGEIPPLLQQWAGPPRTIVDAQNISYASLAASLFSSFLAMLGKQWLGLYASAIERSQNRQRKLDGVVAWCLDWMLRSLPLMLQAALLLLGCAPSRYLWEIDTAVASVVLGVTPFGFLFYLSTFVTGTNSKDYPYQTSWANIIHPLATGVLRPARSFIVRPPSDDGRLALFLSSNVGG